jgi:hypothetical protein
MLWTHKGAGGVERSEGFLFLFTEMGKTWLEEVAGDEDPLPRVLLPGPPHDNAMYGNISIEELII